MVVFLLIVITLLLAGFTLGNLIDFAFGLIKWAFLIGLAVAVVGGVVLWLANNPNHILPAFLALGALGFWFKIKDIKAKEREQVRQWELAAVKAADEALKKKPFDPYQALREIREEREAAKLAAQAQPSDLG